MQEKLAKYGGMANFKEVATDSSSSCLEMRRTVAQRNSGLASFNDKAYGKELLLGDLCKESWVKGAVQRASALSEYVRGYQRLFAACKQAKNQYNAIVSVEVAAEKRTAVAYLTRSTRIFANHRDLWFACVRKSPAQRNILERRPRSALRVPVFPA